MMKKISVLIACYNNGTYFKDCYTSLISQTYYNWEAIIVDDGSTDGSLEMILEMIKNDNRFILYQNSENKGYGFTKRKCMEYATGQICTYLDPEDALYPAALETIVQHYKNDIVATYSKVIICNENLSPQRKKSKIKQIISSKSFCLIQFSYFFTFQKSTYSKTSGVNINLKNDIEEDLYLKMLEFGNIQFVNDILYKFRFHSVRVSQYIEKENAISSFAYIVHEKMKKKGLKKSLEIN